MDDREIYIKEIVQEFAIWERKLSLLSSLNLYDFNLMSEHYAKELLNLVLNYQFQNANALQANHPAVDLIDKDNRTAVQVSTTKTAAKIQKTLNGFHKYELFLLYDRLLIFVLGKKQTTYNTLKVPVDVNFKINTDIIDFEDLVRFINYMPTQSILKIKNIFKSERNYNDTIEENSVKNIQKSMNLKKRLKKIFQSKLPKEQWEYSHYEPWIKFTYHNLILRDPEDKVFPEVDSESCTWLKVECWDFFDQGIEFITHGGDAVFDEHGYWDVLGYNDARENNEKYFVRPFNIFTRLEYLNIAAYDLEPDPYYSSPTIYCTFSKELKHPFSEILYGHAGSAKDKRWTYIFDNKMRKKSGWDFI